MRAVARFRSVAFFAVAFFRAVDLFLPAVAFRFFFAAGLPLPADEGVLAGVGACGAGVGGIGVGQSEPGSFCGDQSLPGFSCMCPPLVVMA